MNFLVALRDNFNLLSKLTFRRFINAIQVVASYQISNWVSKPIQWGLPLSFSIEPTTSCNLRCPECPSGLRAFSRDTGMLQLERAVHFLNELGSTALYVNFYFQGEPFLNKHLFEMISCAVKNKLYTSTSTNAHFLDEQNARLTVESGLDRLIISIDGIDQQSYESYRVGGDLNKVLAGAKALVNWKKKLNSPTPFVIFQFLVVKTNEAQVESIEALARSIGIDEVRFKTAQFYDFKNGNQLLPTREVYSRYRQLPDGTYALKNKLENKCWRLWSSTVVTWDGKVVPCCFDKDAQHQMGDLTQQPFKLIWHSAAYNRFRAAMIQSRSQTEICANCSEGSKVWA